MAVTAVWLALFGAAITLEVVGHRPGRHPLRLTVILSVLWTRRAGRLLLVVVWGFIGWHFFTRYTVPA